MISDLILIAKKFSVPSAYGRRDGVRDFFAQYPDGVYIATDAGAPAGWEGYAVWFGGTGERYAERFMEFIRDGYIVERFLRARVGGLLVFTFRCRLKMRRFGTLGKPHGEPDALNFYMPNGGAISLDKTGSPTVVELEYSLDGGATWTVWPEDGSGNRSLTLTAGQRMYVRNTSETSTGFSTDSSNYYQFAFTDDCYADGPTDSLLCKNYENAILSSYCYTRLYHSCVKLKTLSKLPSTTLAEACYYVMCYGCTGLTSATELPATNLTISCYQQTFQNCSSLTSITLPAAVLAQACYYRICYNCQSLTTVVTSMTDISAWQCMSNWLYLVAATGDFYCPASLTIPTGASGIPSGWTRHDI